MVFTISRQVAHVTIGIVVIVGALAGCSSNTPPPTIPTSVQQVEQEAKELGQGLTEVGKDAAKKLHDVLAEEVPDVKVHFDKLRAESKTLYCTAKAKSAEAAAVVKKEIEKAWSELLVSHPTYDGPKLDLDGTACE